MDLYNFIFTLYIQSSLENIQHHPLKLADTQQLLAQQFTQSIVKGQEQKYKLIVMSNYNYNNNGRIFVTKTNRKSTRRIQTQTNQHIEPYRRTQLSNTNRNRQTDSKIANNPSSLRPRGLQQKHNEKQCQSNSKLNYLETYSKNHNLRQSSSITRKNFKININKNKNLYSNPHANANSHTHGNVYKYMKTEPDQLSNINIQLYKQRSKQKTGSKNLADINNPYSVTVADNTQSTQTGMEKYQFQSITGKGTFGVVYTGYEKQTGKKIAIKKVLQDKRYKNRQLEILKLLNNQNVLEIKDYFLSYEGDKQFLNIIMDYYQYNLYQVIKKKVFNNGNGNPSTSGDKLIKVIMYQILKGLNYLATISISHRDIKPQNVLVDLSKNKAVICDFGSAKQLVKGEPNLAYICSRCYRAPELIFGATDYNWQIDMWSTGCLLVEMINGTPPFLGDSQIDQLIQIIKVLGTPTKQQVLQMNKSYDMKQYINIPVVKPITWKEILHTKDQKLIDLVNKIMQYSPKKRLTASQAIMHQYFNQLRSEQTYKQIQKQLKVIPQLFNFSKQQLRNFANRGLVVPSWAAERSTHGLKDLHAATVSSRNGSSNYNRNGNLSKINKINKINIKRVNNRLI